MYTIKNIIENMLFPNILQEKLKHIIIHQVNIFILDFQMFQKNYYKFHYKF